MADTGDTPGSGGRPGCRAPCSSAGPVPRRAFPAARPARERACRTPWPGSSVRRPRWPAPGPRQMPAVSIIGTLAPAEEAEVPGVSLAAGRTLQADGGNHDRGHDGNFRCDANWCRRYCRCNSGGHHCGGGGLVYPGFPLNAGSQLGGVRSADLSEGRVELTIAACTGKIHPSHDNRARNARISTMSASTATSDRPDLRVLSDERRNARNRVGGSVRACY